MRGEKFDKDETERSEEWRSGPYMIQKQTNVPVTN